MWRKQEETIQELVCRLCLCMLHELEPSGSPVVLRWALCQSSHAMKEWRQGKSAKYHPSPGPCAGAFDVDVSWFVSMVTRFVSMWVGIRVRGHGNCRNSCGQQCFFLMIFKPKCLCILFSMSPHPVLSKLRKLLHDLHDW